MKTTKQIKKEIEALNQNISKFEEMADKDMLSEEDNDDLREMIGWRDALSWALIKDVEPNQDKPTDDAPAALYFANQREKWHP